MDVFVIIYLMYTKKQYDDLVNDTISYYDQSASDFYAQYYAEDGQLRNPNIMFALSMFARKLHKESVVLDVGCGTGDQLWFMSRFASQSSVGIDLSFGMLRFAARKFPDLNLVNSSAINTSFADNTFDAVWSCFLLNHLPKEMVPLLVTEMSRVSKKNSRIGVITYRGVGEEVLENKLYFSYWDERQLRIQFEREFLDVNINLIHENIIHLSATQNGNEPTSDPSTRGHGSSHPGP